MKNVLYCLISSGICFVSLFTFGMLEMKTHADYSSYALFSSVICMAYFLAKENRSTKKTIKK